MRSGIVGFGVVVTLGALVGLAGAQEGKGPRVGDLAPPLTVERWLLGEPVAAFEPGQVYLIDIWAPWCGPCLGGMAELSALQEREAGRGLVVVGLTGVDDYGSTLEKVEKVLADRAADVRYRIAWDHDRQTYRRWMALESSAGWPWCFVVDRQRRIAYIGHPSQLPRVLEPILAGTWNLDSARTAYVHRAGGLERGAAFMSAYRGNHFADARARYEDLRSFDAAMAGDYAAAMFKMLRVKMGRESVADSFARGAAAAMTSSHVGTLVQMVEMILGPEPQATPSELDLALVLARRARALADARDAGVISTLAEVHFRRGEVAEAIATEQAAIEAASAQDRAGFEETLARYRAARR